MAGITRQEAAQQLMEYERNGIYTVGSRLYWKEQIHRMDLVRIYTTAWTCEGHPVSAASGILVNNDDPFDGSGDFSDMTIEFTVEDPRTSRLIHIDQQLKDHQYYLQDPNGNYGNYEQAYAFIKQLSFLSSLFPHVMMCDEYMEVEGGYAAYCGRNQPNVDTYLNVYLTNVVKDLRAGAFYVGQITSADNTQLAIDSVQRYCNNAQREINNHQSNNYQRDNVRQQRGNYTQQENRRTQRTRLDEAEDYYHGMLRHGFSIETAYDVVDSNILVRRISIKTPWFYRGSEVSIDIDMNSLDGSILSIDYSGGALSGFNLTNRLNKRKTYLKDVSGGLIDIDKANSLAAEIVRNTSAIPTLRDFDDYMETEEYRARVEGKPAPSIHTYLDSYIPQMERLEQDPSLVILGYTDTDRELDMIGYNKSEAEDRLKYWGDNI